MVFVCKILPPVKFIVYAPCPLKRLLAQLADLLLVHHLHQSVERVEVLTPRAHLVPPVAVVDAVCDDDALVLDAHVPFADVVRDEFVFQRIPSFDSSGNPM